MWCPPGLGLLEFILELFGQILCPVVGLKTGWESFQFCLLAILAGITWARSLDKVSSYLVSCPSLSISPRAMSEFATE